MLCWVMIKTTITDIQSLGIRVPREISGRKSGAGPAEGKTFLFEGIPCNVPIAGDYVKKSPYHLEIAEDHLTLYKDDRAVMPFKAVITPRFYSEFTEERVSYQKIALLHGKDCLGSTVLQHCSHWNTPSQCGFCSIGLSLQNKQTIIKKSPEQLAEVAEFAVRHDGINHIVLTTGSCDPPGPEILYLAECCKTIKQKTDVPVHVQFAPPDNLNLLDELKAAGVDTVGIHIESFHRPTLERIAPAKAKIGLRYYELAWEKAVNLFGPNQVSSFVIVGLGESPESVVWGSEILADLGVYPFIVPYRPSRGVRLQEIDPPRPDLMRDLYQATADIMRKKSISSKKCLAGCVRCGACSALHLFEGPAESLVCHRTRDAVELADALAIRHDVFVKEQGVFKTTEQDEFDMNSIHLIVKQDNEVVATVRVYPTENGHWIGSRLAVKESCRNIKAGRLLVREAVKRVKKEGATKFTARIQEENVSFFKRLGWRPVGPLIDYCGLPHQLMEADLDAVPPEF